MLVTISKPKLPPVSLKSRWPQILGENRQVVSDSERRQRWEEWKSIASKSGKRGSEMKEYWTEENETCSGCKFKDGDWCTSEELPCNVNPVLTFKEGIPGSACVGGSGYMAKLS